jgi:hypothetical protein
MSDFMKQFREDRKQALAKAVLDDDWGAVRKYCKKYGVEIPKEKRIFKAGVYKAAFNCLDSDPQVIATAYEKCLKLGFSPLLKPRGN